MLPVVVEISPPNPPREQLTVLLAACSRAVAEADCVVAADTPAGGTYAVAIVTWHTEAEVLIEVGLRIRGAPVWRSRSMTFRADDDATERWRAVGFTLGTLARGAQAEEPAGPAETISDKPLSEAARPPPAPVAPKKAEKAAPAPPKAREIVEEPPPERPTKPHRDARFAFDLGARAAPAWDGLRWGGVVRARLPLYRWLRTIAAAAYTQRTPQPGLSGQWFTVALGAGAFTSNQYGELGLSVDARAEYLYARASDGAREEAGAKARFGAGLTLSAAWTPTHPLGLFIAGDLAFVGSRTDILVGPALVQSDPALRAAGEAGVRVRF